MGIWVNILQLGASGDSNAARELLNFQLPFALRYPGSYSSESLQYQGPLSDSIEVFINKLPESDRAMAASRKNDFIDYVLDAIIAGVERTLLLAEFCQTETEITLEKIVADFPAWGGLKRSQEQKRKWVANLLRSMLNQGVPLPVATVTALGSEGDPKYGFNEVAYARAWDLNLSWNDFKEDHELDYHYKCIDDSDNDEEPGVSAEGTDFGMVTMAEIVLRDGTRPDKETLFDLYRIGKELNPEITQLMEEMHKAKPSDGYRPIAWHNVFWNISSEYEGLSINLESRDPVCDADRSLADHISQNYPDVAKPNRLNIFRRRDSLYRACKSKILGRLEAWLGLNKRARRSHM
jgi:hypothetical protein